LLKVLIFVCEALRCVLGVLAGGFKLNALFQSLVLFPPLLQLPQFLLQPIVLFRKLLVLGRNCLRRVHHCSRGAFQRHGLVDNGMIGVLEQNAQVIVATVSPFSPACLTIHWT